MENEVGRQEGIISWALTITMATAFTLAISVAFRRIEKAVQTRKKQAFPHATRPVGAVLKSGHRFPFPSPPCSSLGTTLSRPCRKIYFVIIASWRSNSLSRSNRILLKWSNCRPWDAGDFPGNFLGLTMTFERMTSWHRTRMFYAGAVVPASGLLLVIDRKSVV